MTRLQTRAVLAAAMAGAAIFSVDAQAVVTTYSVTQTYHQLHPNLVSKGNDTIFTGSFQYDDVAQTVSGLSGSLTESMTGNTLGGIPMSTVALNYQLSSVNDGMGGLLVSVFAQNSTDVFTGGGFATNGTATYGNQNAYVTLYLNLADPTAALTADQTKKLAYADCTSGGLMMGSVCMTGWLKADGTAGGTMMGTAPITQTITVAVPEPESYVMLLAGLGLVGFAVRRRSVR